MRRLALAALVLLLLVSGCRGGAAQSSGGRISVAKGAEKLAVVAAGNADAARTVHLPPPYGAVVLPLGSREFVEGLVRAQTSSFVARHSGLADGELKSLAQRGCKAKEHLESAREFGRVVSWMDAVQFAVDQLGWDGHPADELMEMAQDLKERQDASSVGTLAVYGICAWAQGPE